LLEQDLESALAAIPSGYGEGVYEGLRYGVTVRGSLATESGPVCSRERSRLQPLPAEVGRGHANVALAQRRFTFFWRASLTARRDIARLRPAQNFVSIVGGAPKLVREVWSIGHRRQACG
jgi:hypothetical protein